MSDPEEAAGKAFLSATQERPESLPFGSSSTLGPARDR